MAANRPHIYENAPAEHIYMNTNALAASSPASHLSKAPAAAPTAASAASSKAVFAEQDEAGYEILRNVNLPPTIEPARALSVSSSSSPASSVKAAPSYINMDGEMVAGDLVHLTLQRSPRGFGLTLGGGKDTRAGQPYVAQVAADGAAAHAVLVGDVVVEMNGISLSGMTHAAIQDQLKRASSQPALSLVLLRRTTPGEADVYVEVSSPPAVTTPTTPIGARTQSVDTRPYTGFTKAPAPPRAGRSPFIAAVSREAADAILAGKPVGSFLIRPSTTRPSEFVLALKTPDGVDHVGPLGVGEAGLGELVERHKRMQDGLPTLLKQCYANPSAPF